MSGAEVKICSKCGESKDRALFVKGERRCKQCQSEYNRQYRSANRKKLSKSKHQYYMANREKIKDWRTQYRATNKKDIAATVARYYMANRKKILDYTKTFYRSLPDSYVAYKITQGTNLTRADIPPELLEAKRLQLKLKRIAREAMK